MRIGTLGSLAVGVLLGGAMLACVSAVPACAIGAQAEPFGIVGFSMQTTEASVASEFVNEPYMFTQAGGHPVALTSTVEFASEENGADHTIEPTRDPKDVIIHLPAGLVANPRAVPRCSVEHSVPCPTDTQVGTFVIHFALEGSQMAILGPIVNLMPAGDTPAELGLETPLGMFSLTGRVVRTPEGYSLALTANGLPALGILGIEATLWGVPAASVHNHQRGLSCIEDGSSSQSECHAEGEGVPSEQKPVAFLTMGSECSTAPQTAMVWADSWQEPEHYVQGQSTLPPMEYCERLPFDPEIAVRPETLLADEPVGMDVSIRVPQIEELALIDAPPLREATVTLPRGVSINPSVGDGQQACEPAGPAGINIPTGLSASGDALQPGETGPGEELVANDEPELIPGHCPEASTVGTALASTPLLAHPIEGRVYLARPECGAPDEQTCTEQDAADGRLYRLYVELNANTGKQTEGILLKLEARVQANPATGQLTVRFIESPQLPLNELDIHLFGGPDALLANPATCGPAITTSDLQPWSAPYTPDADPSSFYNVTGCANTSTLDPRFVAGSANVSAGEFSPFKVTVARDNREQYLAAIQLHAPPGLSAMLSSVPLCDESPTSAGRCPEASRIGSSLVATGAGTQPLYLPGSIYLTTGYGGAPFGLSIVTDAVAGPLNLGSIVIHARIDIDPQSSALTITSEPLPQIALGVPLRIQSVTLDINQPGFMFNPTNCSAQQITATITGAQGASADVSDRFALANCYDLAFKPALKSSTSAPTSYKSGAKLDMRLTFPKTNQGTEANVARIKLTLPMQLASRLTTLQDACPYIAFDTDPATCSKDSVVGIARVRTPMLPAELTGPVYLVAHGRHAFPAPAVVLQGDGVRLDLGGSTVVEDSGTSSISFNALPDVPIDSFELYLPRGPHSMLGATTSLCAPSKTITIKREIAQHAHGRTVHRTVRVRRRVAASLTMPSELVAQNGTIVHQSTKVEVTGCTTNGSRGPRQ